MMLRQMHSKKKKEKDGGGRLGVRASHAHGPSKYSAATLKLRSSTHLRRRSAVDITDSTSVPSSPTATASGAGNADRESVRVLVRCRPFIESEEVRCKSRKSVFLDKAAKTVDISALGAFRTFSFDDVFLEDEGQIDVFEAAQPLVMQIFEGFNSSILAYGQTSSGKTHTMVGSLTDPEEYGLIGNVVDLMFDHIALMDNQSDESVRFLVYLSFLEVYNEKVRDCLGSDSSKSLDVHQDSDLNFHVPELSMHVVDKKRSILKLVRKGMRNRVTSATVFNEHSSRSHAVITIHLERSCGDNMTRARLNLVDLAGSEKLSKSSGVSKEETVGINQSLACLANVISALTDPARRSGGYIPYRDSKLTRLLKDSLGGSTKTLMIACINPCTFNAGETLNTLRYAARAKRIKNKPKPNIKPQDAIMQQMMEEMDKLRQLLSEKDRTQEEMLRMVKELGSSARAMGRNSSVVLVHEGGANTDAENEADDSDASEQNQDPAQRIRYLSGFFHTPRVVKKAAAKWASKALGKGSRLSIKLWQTQTDDEMHPAPLHLVTNDEDDDNDHGGSGSDDAAASPRPSGLRERRDRYRRRRFRSMDEADATPGEGGSADDNLSDFDDDFSPSQDSAVAAPSSLEGAKAMLLEFQKELTQLQKGVEQTRRATADKITTELNGQIAMLTAQNRTLTKERDAAHAEMEAKTGELTDLVAHLKEQLRDAENAVVGSKGLQADLGASRLENTRQGDVSSQPQAAVNARGTADKETQSSTSTGLEDAEVERLVQLVAELEKERDDLAHQVDDMSRQSASLEEKGAELARNKQALAEALPAQEALATQLSEANARAGATTTTTTTAAAAPAYVTRLKDQLRDAEKAVLGSAGLHASLQADLEASRQTNSKQGDVIAQLQATVNGLSAAAKEAEGSLEEKDAELARKGRELAEALSAQEVLKKQLAEADARAAAATAAAAARASVDTSAGKSRDKNSEVERLRQVVAELEKERDDLTQQVDDLLLEIQTLRAERVEWSTNDTSINCNGKCCKRAHLDGDASTPLLRKEESQSCGSFCCIL